MTPVEALKVIERKRDNLCDILDVIPGKAKDRAYKLKQEIEALTIAIIALSEMECE